MAKFNDQIEPIYALLRKVEDMRLSAAILEPEPTDYRPARLIHTLTHLTDYRPARLIHTLTQLTDYRPARLIHSHTLQTTGQPG